LRGEPEHLHATCNNKCQRTQTSVSTSLCITPHAVDRDFQARKQESVTLACGLNQGRFRGAIVRPPACCRHHSLTQSLFQVVSIIIDCYRSDTARKLSSSRPAIYHASQCSCVLVRMRVTVSDDRRAGQSGSGSSNHSQVAAITHSCSHR
jgi:hypothetical protein